MAIKTTRKPDMKEMKEIAKLLNENHASDGVKIKTVAVPATALLEDIVKVIEKLDDKKIEVVDEISNFYNSLFEETTGESNSQEGTSAGSSDASKDKAKSKGKSKDKKPEKKKASKKEKEPKERRFGHVEAFSEAIKQGGTRKELIALTNKICIKNGGEDNEKTSSKVVNNRMTVLMYLGVVTCEDGVYGIPAKVKKALGIED